MSKQGGGKKPVGGAKPKPSTAKVMPTDFAYVWEGLDNGDGGGGGGGGDGDAVRSPETFYTLSFRTPPSTPGKGRADPGPPPPKHDPYRDAVREEAAHFCSVYQDEYLKVVNNVWTSSLESFVQKMQTYKEVKDDYDAVAKKLKLDKLAWGKLDDPLVD